MMVRCWTGLRGAGQQALALPLMVKTFLSREQPYFCEPVIEGKGLSSENQMVVVVTPILEDSLSNFHQLRDDAPQGN